MLFEENVRRVLNEKSGPEISEGIAAVRTLLELINSGDATTFSELVTKLRTAVKIMRECTNESISMTSGCELFMRFISNIRDEGRDESFEQCKTLMLERGNKFVKKVDSSRLRIAKLGSQHIKENSKILVHSRSRVVLELLKEASKDKQFKVFVTESRPDGSGDMAQELKKHKIEVECILDAAIGYVMETIDLVLVGAEGVLASGGIVNKIGTFSIAMAAKAFNRPVYVAAESFKFSNLYPLNQKDLPNKHKYESLTEETIDRKKHPLIDYTPPEYLTLLFTDIGILTPTAVSDELIKLA